MQVHARLHLQTPLSVEHFRCWLKIFRETIDEIFKGEQVEFAKTRAEAIANRMQIFNAEFSAKQIQNQNNFSEAGNSAIRLLERF